jgi:hypothetical protein
MLNAESYSQRIVGDGLADEYREGVIEVVPQSSGYLRNTRLLRVSNADTRESIRRDHNRTDSNNEKDTKCRCGPLPNLFNETPHRPPRLTFPLQPRRRHDHTGRRRLQAAVRPRNTCPAAPPPPTTPEELELEREMEYFVEPEEAFTGRDEIE